MIRYSVKGKKGRKVAAFLGVTALSVALLAMPVMAKGTGTVTGTGVNVRKSAGTAAEKVTTVTTGDQLRVTGSKKDSTGKKWYKVTFTQNGTNYTGYIISNYVNYKKDAATPDHYTDTRKLFDYCFENFQAMNISENDAGLAKDNGKNYGVLNNSEPYVKLDEDAYIIMPKGAQFSDVSYKKTESAKGKKKVARLAYTYAGHEVGSVDIVKTGAKVKDKYYVNTDSGQKKNERVIRIDPAWLIVAGVVIVAAVVLLFLAKRAYDNFYVIRHQRKTKKNDKMRFREKKRKKYNRRKDRFF